MSNSRQEIEINARKHYETNGLHVMPSLAGAQHLIQIDGYRLRFELPKRPRSEDWTSLDSPIACYAYRQHAGGRRRPMMFSVRQVTCILDSARTTKVPTKALGAVNVTLFGPREREKLRRWTDEYSIAMDNAFSHWLSVLRWRSGIYSIGAPYEKRGMVCDNTHLFDRRSGRRFFAESTVIRVESEAALSARHWRDVQAVLDRNESTPMWHILLAEAAHQLKLQDQRRFLVDLALACEVVLRHLMQVFLTQRVAIELIDTMAITRVLDSLKHSEFGSARSKALTRHISNVKKIIEHRNRIMHRGWRPNIAPAECMEFQRYAVNFVSAVEGWLIKRVVW